MGFVPFANDAYELFVGKSIVKGESLSNTERAIAGVGLIADVLTLGAATATVGAVKLLGRLGKNIFKRARALDKLQAVQKIFDKSGEIYDSARKLGFETKEGLSKLTKEFQELLGNQAGHSRLHEPFVDMLENLVKKGYRKADPSKVVNALNDYSKGIYQVGDNAINVTKTNMKHILERHHPNFWNGTIKNQQSFFPSKVGLDQIKNVMGEVINKNRDRIVKEGTRRIKLSGVVDGTDYVLTIADGQVVQFFPKLR